jgi:hypothetical protein
MGIVPFLFLLFQFAVFNFGWNNAEVTNAASVLQAEDNNPIHLAENDVAQLSHDEVNAQMATYLGEPQYLLVAPENNAYSINVMKWFKLLRYSFAVYSSLDELPEAVPEAVIGVVICDGNLDNVGDMEVAFAYAEAGKDLIFASYFDTSAAAYQSYHDRLGISVTGKTYLQDDIDFLNRILISGMYLEANIDVTANQVQLNGKSAVLAVGCDETIPKYEDRNPMIWRTYWQNGAIYCFNNDLLADFTNIGVFTGVISLNKDVFMYPIINANMVQLGGMPYFSDAYDQNVLDTYGRNTTQFQYDVMWVDLLGITKTVNLRYTLYPTVGSNQEEIEQAILPEIGKAFTINGIEIGAYPSTIFSGIYEGYTQRTTLGYESDQITSRLVFDPSAFAFDDNGVVNIPVISSVTDNEDNSQTFRALSVASAMGYVSQYCDLNTIIESQTGEDLWTQYKLNFIEGYYPVSITYDYLDLQTATETANKLSTYLNLIPQIEVGQNEIHIKAQNQGSTSYILRTLRNILDTENCTYQKLSTDYYLVTVADKDAVLYTEPSK